MGLSAHCACLSTMPPWECPKILEKEQWPSSNSPNLNGMEISCLCMSDARSYILKPSSEAQNGFWIISRTENILDNFPQVQIIKLCRALQIVWQEYICEQWRKIFYMSIRLYSKKVFALTAFALSWIVETIFGNVSTAKFPWLKAAYNVVNFADNILKLSTFTDNWMNNHCVKFYIIPLYSAWKISKILYRGYFLACPRKHRDIYKLFDNECPKYMISNFGRN